MTPDYRWRFERTGGRDDPDGHPAACGCVIVTIDPKRARELREDPAWTEVLNPPNPWREILDR